MFRAVNDYENNRLKSRNVHSEIVFSLSPNNNVSFYTSFICWFSLRVKSGVSLYDAKIAESFRRFGVADITTNLLVIKISTSPNITQESIRRHLQDVIHGTPFRFENSSLASMTDLARVRKIYKLNTPSQNGHAKANSTQLIDIDERKELEVVVLGIMALRGAS